MKLAIGCGNVPMVEHLLNARANPSLAEGLFRHARGAEDDLVLAEYVLMAGGADSASTLSMLTLLDGHGWQVCRIVCVEKNKVKKGIACKMAPAVFGVGHVVCDRCAVCFVFLLCDGFYDRRSVNTLSVHEVRKCRPS